MKGVGDDVIKNLPVLTMMSSCSELCALFTGARLVVVPVQLHKWCTGEHLIHLVSLIIPDCHLLAAHFEGNI